jgi:general secretion pathway protein K
MALLIVIWVLALLAAVAAAVTAETRTGTQLARNQLENARARALAEAGISLGALALLEPGAAETWATEGGVREFPYAGGLVQVSVEDEFGKIDVNVAPDALLAGLFESVGLDAGQAAALVDAIADWRDQDDFRRPDGAEAADYRRAGLDYGPGNRPFEAVEELRSVLGMNRSLYARISPLVTVYSHSTRINPMTAPPDVLRALPGVGSDAVRRFLAARADASVRLSAPSLLLGAEPYLAPAPPRIVTIRAHAVTASGAVFVREAVIVLTGNSANPYGVLEWRQGALSMTR